MSDKRETTDKKQRNLMNEIDKTQFEWSEKLPGEIFGRRDFLRNSAAAGIAGAAGANLLTGAGSAQQDSSWQKENPRLKTPWFDEVSPDNSHPEYPRPQMVREDWQNLNGLWGFTSVSDLDTSSPPTGKELDEEILVPFPVESSLSGIEQRTDQDRMWYRRTFSVPNSWLIPTAHPGKGVGNNPNSQRLLLHFEAVDWDATVFVNGQEVGGHDGSYDSFTFDVTDALTHKGEQELIVGVRDPTDDGGQPLGKQRDNPGGIFYTASSGIWQSVWMEPVPKASIERLDMTPDLSTDELSLTVETSNANDHTVEATAYAGDTEVGSVTGQPNEELRLPVPDPNLWSPDNPFLYDLNVRLVKSKGNGKSRGKGKTAGGKTVDEVESYFGMRSVGLREVNGTLRPTLNGEFVFQMATLDQGYWPDGIYTPPTDEALKFDLIKHKEMGFNTVRKHVKVENNRWFYHADKLGLLVWQDMPSPRLSGGTDEQEFEEELRQMIEEHGNHPSVIMWVPFNEGWGRFDTTRITSLVDDLDPSRLVDGMSGMNICGCDPGNGDVIDWHVYPGPGAPAPTDKRASVLGEYGGLGLAVEGHLWADDGFSYNDFPNADALMDEYVQKISQIQKQMEACGLSAAIYTQISDVEREINGLLTYDRKVLKPAISNDVSRMKEVHENLIRRSRNLEASPPEPDEGTPGLEGVGYWPFNQESGDTAPDQANGYNGTLVNGPTWTDGKSGNALQFDGNDDYVDTGASILDVDTDFSVAAWVKLNDKNGFQTVMSQNRDGTSAFFLQYSAADNRLSFSTANTRALADEPPETGKWYHMVGVMENYHGQQKLYINGEQVASVRSCIGIPADGNTYIGRANFGGDQVDFWNGKIDQAHVYEKPLTAEEVSDLYESSR